MIQAHIVVIAGEPQAIAHLSTRLARMGYRVSTLAWSDADILHALVELRPDVVLAPLPATAEPDALALVTSLQARLDLPVVYITTAAQHDVFEVVMATAPYGYMSSTCPARHMQYTIETARARYRVERQLQRQAQLLDLTLQSLEEPLIATDAQGQITRINAHAAHVTGWLHDTALGQPITTVLRLLQPTQGVSLEHPALHALQLQQPVWFPADTICVTRDGRRLPLAGCAAPLLAPPDRAEGVVLLFRDLTTQRRLEAQRHQTQVMQMLDTLTGGMAHHFNNMLNGILGFTELALDSLPPESPIKAYLEHVLKAGQRASDLVSQMLVFSRQQRLERYPINPAMLLRQGLASLQGTIPAQITMQEDVDLQDGMILGDATQLHEVLKHLYSNAVHAMQATGGTLHIRLARAEVDAAMAALQPALQPGTYMLLTVSDTGHGMTPEVQAHMFEPFFTTKEVGEGSGMGLAIVRGIVIHHGGAVLIDSTPDEGTTVQVYLPLLPDAGA